MTKLEVDYEHLKNRSQWSNDEWRAYAEARAQFARLASTGLVDEIAIISHTQEPVGREQIIRLVGEMIADLSRGVRGWT